MEEEEVIMEEASGTEEVTEAMQPDAISAQPNLPLVPNLTYSQEDLAMVDMEALQVDTVVPEVADSVVAPDMVAPDMVAPEPADTEVDLVMESEESTKDTNLS